MSSTVVIVRRIDSVAHHPNADRLDLAVVGGWQCVVQRGAYKAGDLVTYIPPDSVLPEALAKNLGVTQYLSNGRVRAVKLRGEPSFGLVIPPEGNEGDNVANALGITKYQPPMTFNPGEDEAEHPAFVKYTDIENMRHFTTMFRDGEEVIASEKIHGTNSRVGLVADADGSMKRVSGSKTRQRKNAENSIYWFPWSVPGVESMLEEVRQRASAHAILFGEVYGKVQAMKYGIPGGLAYRAFDLLVDGRYASHDVFRKIADRHGVPTAPIVYRGPFSMAKIAELSKGKSLISGADHIREGVVVKPAEERWDPRVGRVVLKYVSDDYLVGNYDGGDQ